MSKEEKGKEVSVFTEEKKLVIKNQFFPKATDTEVEYFLGIAESLGLNPLTKEIQFVPRKANIAGYNEPAQWVEKYDPIVGRDGRLAIAHKSGVFEGIESYTEMKDTYVLNNGKFVKGNDLFATAKVYKKGHKNPFVVEVAFQEYVGKNKNGDITNIWASKPHTMLKKVAESQALSKAFNINGVTTEEELDSYIHNDAPNNKPQKLERKEDPFLNQVGEIDNIEDVAIIEKPSKNITKEDLSLLWTNSTKEDREKIKDKIMHIQQSGFDSFSQDDINEMYADMLDLLSDDAI